MVGNLLSNCCGLDCMRLILSDPIDIRQLEKHASVAIRDGEELRWLGRNLGRWLTTERSTDDFRGVAAALVAQIDLCDDFTKGYRRGLSDVISASALARDELVDELELQARALRPQWRRIIEALSTGPCLQKDLPIPKADASRALEEMRQHHLVELWSGAGSDRRTRLHRLTAIGRALARTMRLEPQIGITRMPSHDQPPLFTRRTVTAPRAEQYYRDSSEIESLEVAMKRDLEPIEA
jgi:DNA-binding MarR family transcriptional regulator